MNAGNNPLHVLIVEDVSEVAKTYDFWIKTYDASQNLTTEVVSRYGDAMERIDAGERDGLQKIDVVILDLMLPDASGLNALILMRNRWLFLPIIVVSGSDFTEEEALEAGACDYFQKGLFSGKDLVSAIRRDWVRRDVIAKTRPVHDSIRNYDEGLQSTGKALEEAKEALREVKTGSKQ